MVAMLHVQNCPNLVLALPVEKPVNQWERVRIDHGAVIQPPVVHHHALFAGRLLGYNEGQATPSGCAPLQPATGHELLDQLCYGGFALADKSEGLLNSR